jgi:hypothetical protein
MKYNTLQLELMRERIATSEAECLMMDENMLLVTLLEGHDGWNNVSDEKVLKQYESIYGKFDG